MIELRNVNYTYNRGMPDERCALCGVSLVIPRGSLCAVIGRTGSGKSTLVRHLNGLLMPDSGEVIVDGEDITKKGADLRAVRRKVGPVFQYPEYQLFEETVERDIAFAPRSFGLSDAEVKRRVSEAAELMGISERCLKRSPFELSGGEKRRAAIAGVLAAKPEVLVLDEPAAGLDPAGRRRMMELIQSIKAERDGMSVVFVSHSMEDVAEYAERVVVMDGGRVVTDGAPKDVFVRTAELEGSGLGVPQAARVMQRLAESGLDVATDVYSVEDAVREIERVLR